MQSPKIIRIHTFGALFLWLALPFTAADAAIIMTLTGTPGSSIITVSGSGSTTATSDSTVNLFGFHDVWSSQWITNSGQANLDTDLPGNGFGFYTAQVGALTVTNTTTSVSTNTTTLLLDADSPIEDVDLSVGFPGLGLAVVSGNIVTFSGSATFDLSAGNPNTTFDDFIPGTYTSTRGTYVYEDGRFSDPFTLNIQTIPEPSSLGLLGIGAICLIGRKRRPKQAA